jgi:hypothetical protein
MTFQPVLSICLMPDQVRFLLPRHFRIILEDIKLLVRG